MSETIQLDTQSIALVSPLSDFGRTNVAQVGGKAANLGELLRAGFDVPPGFVITTAAYDLLMQSNHLQAGLEHTLASLDPDVPASSERVSQQILAIMEQTPTPASIIKAVLDAYCHLGGAVAVRSSATAEDLAEAAFAGQQETFLNIIGEQAVLNAVRACWASLWSERAILYRVRQKVDQASVKLAVVVQQMVPTDVAGVMLTANPVSGERGELVIDASPGLGEAVVSGLVTPDHFVLDKHTWRIKEQHLGQKETTIQAKAGGGTEQIKLEPENGSNPVLSHEALRILAQLGSAIEQHYTAPQDIEWAWQKDQTKTGKFFILQARPITTLPEPLKTSPAMRYIIPMLAEMWPTRPYPLDMTTFTGALEHAVGDFLASVIGKNAPNPDKALLQEDGVVVKLQPPEFHPSLSLPLAIFLALWRTRQYDPAHWQDDPQLPEVVQRAKELNAHDLHSLSWSQNIETLHEALALIPPVMHLREQYFLPALLGLGKLWLMLRVAGQGKHMGELLGGVETKTTETNRALEKLASQLRQNPILSDLFTRVPADELQSALEQSQDGKIILEQFAAFLDEYGHREITLTISQGAWKDQPEHVLGILKVLVATEPQQTDSYQSWKRSRDALLAHSILGIWPLRNLFLKALTNGRSLFQMREDTHYYATLALPIVRHVALELGSRLEKTSALTTATDVFHLRLEELEPLGENWPPTPETSEQLRALVFRRQAKRESLASTPMVDPRLLVMDTQARPGEDVLLAGTPGSPGVASGPARIIRDGSEFGKLQQGDVLVAPVTNPAWTPLFLHAAAVVVDAGGSASHAAIVAREYGVPAVMGTINGTQQLTDGQWIQVDGSRGLVLKGEKPE